MQYSERNFKYSKSNFKYSKSNSNYSDRIFSYKVKPESFLSNFRASLHIDTPSKGIIRIYYLHGRGGEEVVVDA
jgi:hypothetical protein